MVAEADNGWQQVVTRTVMIPATTSSNFTGGWQLMGVPFTFNDFALQHAMDLQLGTFAAESWNANAVQYQAVSQLVPGSRVLDARGRFDQRQDEPVPVGGGRQYNRRAGWRARCSPQNIDLSRGLEHGERSVCLPGVLGTGSGLLRGKHLHSGRGGGQRLDRKTLFSWNSASGEYDTLSDDTSLVVPWMGYWLRAMAPVTLVFQPSIFPESNVTAPSTCGSYVSAHPWLIDNLSP